MYQTPHTYPCKISTLSPKSNAVRDDIKSSGKFTIFSYLKIEGGRGSEAHYGKMATKIKTIHYIFVKMTQNDL